MKKILYTKFKGIDEVIAKIMSSPEFKKAQRRSKLYKFWEKVVGEKFSKHSKPYSMMPDSVMIIACENGVIAQELMLRKTKIIKDFEPYLKSLNLKIKDIRFDPKKWEKD